MVKEEIYREKKEGNTPENQPVEVLREISSRMEKRLDLLMSSLDGFLASTQTMEEIKPRHPEREDPSLKGSTRAMLITVIKRIRGFFRMAIIVIRHAYRDSPTNQEVRVARRTLKLLEIILEYERSWDED